MKATLNRTSYDFLKIIFSARVPYREGDQYFMGYGVAVKAPPGFENDRNLVVTSFENSSFPDLIFCQEKK
jgi:hypothetical protein